MAKGASVFGGKIIVMLGLAILLPLLTYTGYVSIKPAPQLRDFVRVTPFIPGVRPTPEQQAARSNSVKEGNRQYQIAARKFAITFIFIMTAFGTAEILAGAYIGLPGFASGLIIAGILTIIWSNSAYYAVVPAIVHFASYLMGLLGILLVGIRMLRKTETQMVSQS